MVQSMNLRVGLGGLDEQLDDVMGAVTEEDVMGAVTQEDVMNSVTMNTVTHGDVMTAVTHGAVMTQEEADQKASVTMVDLNRVLAFTEFSPSKTSTTDLGPFTTQTL